MKDRVEALGEVAGDVLQRMLRELLARKPGGHLVESNLHSVELPLELALKRTAAEPGRFARNLVRAMDRVLDQAIQQAAAFLPGHAWCHRCENASCRHSRPPSCRHVFIGYKPTGMPRWEDFAQFCLELKHPGVDLLYENPPAVLTLVQDQQELHGAILNAFKNGSYDLLGQVTAGFFPVRARVEEGRGVLALTVQAAASRGPRGLRRFGLNLLGRAPSGDSLDTLWERHEELPWRRAVHWAQSALQDMDALSSRRGDRRQRLSRAGQEQRVAGIMRGLARRLERDQRARSRRTRHAEHRHASGTRPTRKAVDDARGAGAESLMVDERSGTVVVLGDRGRTHFFTPQGQLVSSVRYSKDAIARKIRLEQWRAASQEECGSFRSSLPD